MGILAGSIGETIVRQVELYTQRLAMVTQCAVAHSTHHFSLQRVPLELQPSSRDGCYAVPLAEIR